jgi:hypothetical protein
MNAMMLVVYRSDLVVIVTRIVAFGGLVICFRGLSFRRSFDCSGIGFRCQLEAGIRLKG